MTEREMDNANTEGESSGTISFGGPSSFSQEQSSDPFGKGESGTGSGRGKLFADPGPGVRGFDSGLGDFETTKRKRGRPKGSTKSAKLTGDKLAAARRKLCDTMAGVVGFGFAQYGMFRAKLYKKFSPELANQVYSCYQLEKDKAQDIGEPLADTFMAWFPQHVETAAKSVDPGLAVIRLVTTIQVMNEREKYVCAMWQQRFAPPQQPSANGHTMPETENVEETTEEWKQEMPSPEEINPSYTSPSV